MFICGKEHKKYKFTSLATQFGMKIERENKNIYKNIILWIDLHLWSLCSSLSNKHFNCRLHIFTDKQYYICCHDLMSMDGKGRRCAKSCIFYHSSITKIGKKTSCRSTSYLILINNTIYMHLSQNKCNIKHIEYRLASHGKNTLF